MTGLQHLCAFKIEVIRAWDAHDNYWDASNLIINIYNEPRTKVMTQKYFTNCVGSSRQNVSLGSLNVSFSVDIDPTSSSLVIDLIKEDRDDKQVIIGRTFIYDFDEVSQAYIRKIVKLQKYHLRKFTSGRLEYQIKRCNWYQVSKPIQHEALSKLRFYNDEVVRRRFNKIVTYFCLESLFEKLLENICYLNIYAAIQPSFLPHYVKGVINQQHQAGLYLSKESKLMQKGLLYFFFQNPFILPGDFSELWKTIIIDLKVRHPRRYQNLKKKLQVKTQEECENIQLRLASEEETSFTFIKKHNSLVISSNNPKDKAALLDNIYLWTDGKKDFKRIKENDGIVITTEDVDDMFKMMTIEGDISNDPEEWISDPEQSCADLNNQHLRYEERFSQTGEKFFVDHFRRITTWTDPISETRSVSKQENSLPPLPPLWEERKLSNGKIFFIDHSNKETTWEDPRFTLESKTDVREVASKSFKVHHESFMTNIKRNIPSGKLEINIRRSDIVADSFNQIMKHKGKDGSNLRKQLWVDFMGEKGQDFGGVSRDWFHSLSTELFDPKYGLFKYLSDDNYSLEINHDSGFFNDNHLEMFVFIGRIIGMAIFHHKMLSVFFIRPFYSMILGL